MSLLKNIEKFNTHSMSEETVLAVVTGRDTLIKSISETIAGNIEQETMQHIVLIGPRGMGKSFMLRYFEIITKNNNSDEKFIDFSMLPEEQPNISTPTEFIEELLFRITGGNIPSKSSAWDDKNESWETVVEKLNNKISEQKKKYKNYLFIAAVENLDILIDKVFSTKVNESRLRKLLTNTPCFMLFGSSKKYDIDNDYNKRLFHAFQKYAVEPWIEKDYLNYFNKRYEILKKEKPEEFKNKDITILTNKLKAISKYTGGSPRMAVVLTNLIFDEDAVSTAQTLNNIVEDLTPYYQDLMEKLPPKSSILFDALIRSEENISQSELAVRVGATQATISQAFKWLVINNYITARRVDGEKQYRYAVADRVFVLFYYKRYIHCGIECNYIKVLSDFMIAFYNTRELCEYSLKYLHDKFKREGVEFAKMVFKKKGIYSDNIKWDNYDEISAELKKIIKSEEIMELLFEGIPKYINNEFENSLEFFLRAFDLIKLEDDILNQPVIFILTLIELNFEQLKQYEKAIEYFKQVYGSFNQKNSLTGQGLVLRFLGMNYKELQQYEKAIECHKQAYELYKKENKIEDQAKNIGQIGCIYLLMSNEQAWTIFTDDNYTELSGEDIFREYVNAVIYKEKWAGHAPAFEMANTILIALKEKDLKLNKHKALKNFFVGLLNMKLSFGLLKDICKEATGMFGQEEDIVIRTVQYCMEYIESGKDEKYLQKLNPDMAIAVETIVRESTT